MTPVRIALALALALTASTAGAQVHLAYRMPSNQAFTMTVRSEFDPPLKAAIRATVISQLRITRAGNPMGVAQTLRRQMKDRPDQVVSITHALSARGEVSDLAGIDERDAGQAFLARATTIALPTLPDRPVVIGETWTDQRNFYVPANSHVPDGRIALKSTYTLSDVLGTVAHIKFSTAGSANSIVVRYSGVFDVDIATGRPIAGAMWGTVTKEIRFLPDISIRLAVSVRTTGPSIARAGNENGAGQLARAATVQGAYEATLLGLR